MSLLKKTDMVVRYGLKHGCWFELVLSRSWAGSSWPCAGASCLGPAYAVLKYSQSNLVALPFVSKLKSNKGLRWLNCCFKQSVFSACPRQTSGRLVLMFTNRTRWQSLKRASPESLTPACVSAGKHTDSIHLLTYYLHYDCSQWWLSFICCVGFVILP